MFNAIVQGWVNYYGKFYKSAMYSFLINIERFLIRWATRKYKRFRRRKKRASWLRQERNILTFWVLQYVMIKIYMERKNATGILSQAGNRRKE